MTDLDSIRSRWAGIAGDAAILTIGIPEGAIDEPWLSLHIEPDQYQNLDEERSTDRTNTYRVLENVCADVAHLLALIDRHGITDAPPCPDRHSHSVLHLTSAGWVCQRCNIAVLDALGRPIP